MSRLARQQDNSENAAYVNAKMATLGWLYSVTKKHYLDDYHDHDDDDDDFGDEGWVSTRLAGK